MLENKVALVTGGSRGIGEAIASAMATAGATVVIASRKQGPLEEAAQRIAEATGGRVLAKVCHVGQPEQLKELVAWCDSEVGVVDVLVNNAATNPYFGPMLGLEMPAWDKTFEVNCKGTFLLTRAVVEQQIAAGKPGSIINLTSILGMGSSPFQGVYGMTKAALISMTQTLAVELGPHGIRVNAIAPGLVDTKFASALTSSPELLKMFTDRTALGRIAKPEDIAGAAVFLASDAARYITGQTMPVDGGYTIR